MGALEERALPGVTFRPVWFQPVFQKHANERCGGVQVHITSRTLFRPVATGIHMIDTVRRLWPSESGWRVPKGERGGQGGMPYIDRLYGSARLRERFEDGADAEQIIGTWDTSAFEARRRRAFVY